MGATSSVTAEKGRLGLDMSQGKKMGREKIPTRQETGIRFKKETKETMLERKRKTRDVHSLYVKEKTTNKKELINTLFATKSVGEATGCACHRRVILFALDN